MLIDKEPHTTITLEQLLRGIGPRGVLLALARTAERLATEDAAALWPQWLMAADRLLECATLMPDIREEQTASIHAWHRALVQ